MAILTWMRRQRDWPMLTLDVCHEPQADHQSGGRLRQYTHGGVQEMEKLRHLDLAHGLRARSRY